MIEPTSSPRKSTETAMTRTTRHSSPKQRIIGTMLAITAFVAASLIGTIIWLNQTPQAPEIPSIASIPNIETRPPIRTDFNNTHEREEPTPTNTAPTPIPTSTKITVQTGDKADKPMTERETAILEYASCNNRFTDDAMQERAEAAMNVIDHGIRSIAEVVQQTKAFCQSQQPVTDRMTAEKATTQPTYIPQTAPTTASPIPEYTREPEPTKTPTKVPKSQNTPTPQSQTAYRMSHFQNGRWLKHNDPALYDRISRMPWIADGIEGIEYQIVEQILFLAVEHHQEVVERLISMPFLVTPDPHDVSALKGLYRSGEDPRKLAALIDHPTLQGGITDQWTPVIAAINTKNAAPTLNARLLDPNVVNIQNKITYTPLSQSVHLAVIRDGPAGGAQLMQALEKAVIAAETFMATPFPNLSVIILITDTTHPGNAGTNHDSHITIRRHYDTPQSNKRGVHTPRIIAHEISHYYWNSNEDWIDEGMSDLTASVVLYITNEQPIETTNTPCAEATTIRELTNLNPQTNQPAFRCNYSLGERFFLDMFRSTGDLTFRENVRNLYLSSKAATHSGNTLGISHIQNAFSADPRAKTVIDRWYHGTEPYNKSRMDASEPNPDIPEINGRIKSVHVSATQSGSPETEFSSSRHKGWIHLVVRYTNQTDENVDLPITVVEYYEDGFQTRTAHYSLNGHPDYSGGTKSISIGADPTQTKKPGNYWAMIYVDDRKIGQVQWTIGT